ncbi:MAG TPA: amidohydrolase family protein [Vicinamibacterales bacterium]|jgi:4-oxalmesaconate hydratase|nr:amidohydrolase family protein [Vicinamibacterales bacterium]
MVIDAHGHYTTVPAGLRVFRALQISSMGKPVKSAVNISDDEIRASLEKGQIRLLDERGIDVMLFSPMASAMGHHFGNALVSRYWTEVNNDLIHRVCRLYPARFVGVCSLPQSAGVSPGECAQELERCVNEFGFVGCNLNPDPSGGYWTGPPLGDEWWYPLYAKLQQLDVPAMIHASATCNPAFHTTGSHYLNTDATAFFQLMESRVLRDFPKLRIVMPHGGGNVPYQAARYRALCIMNKWEPFDDFIKRIYFDTTVYNQDAMELLIKVVGVDNIVFASEMLGGVNTTDPATGKSFDDNGRFIDAISWLTDQDRSKIFEGNARKAYPRLDVALARV